MSETKLKDLDCMANLAWSPKAQNPILLAAGTAVPCTENSSNTSGTLKIYSSNLTEPGPSMLLKVNAPSEHRFHKIIWGSNGENGIIVGGCDDGLIQIYDVTKLFNDEDGSIAQPNKHSGPVRALDFNPIQANLFASGAGKSEISIWDVNNTSTPTVPRTKSEPLIDVLSVSWNRQNQHILASTFAKKCVIWDLRTNEPKVNLIAEPASRTRWRSIAWHPNVATQLCLGSEEYVCSNIQLWDLRFATSPTKKLESHKYGILSIAWCQEDANLLISSGKDNRILGWNPNKRPNGELLWELAKAKKWNFDVQWCPENPAIIACPSHDGRVYIYSLKGDKAPKTLRTTGKVAEGSSSSGIKQLAGIPVSKKMGQQFALLKAKLDKLNLKEK